MGGEIPGCDSREKVRRLLRRKLWERFVKCYFFDEWVTKILSIMIIKLYIGRAMLDSNQLILKDYTIE